MTPEKQIQELTSRIELLERNFEDHKHTGLDSLKVLPINLNDFLYKEVTINPASLVDGAGVTQSVTVKGSNLGDFVLVSAPYDLQDVTVTGYMQATDTVEVRIQNESTGTRDLASGTWRIIVIKKFI